VHVRVSSQLRRVSASHGSGAVVHPGVLDTTEKETAILRGLREDGATVEMEEKGSRLLESNGACVKLGTSLAWGTSFLCCQRAHGISQTHRINLDAQRPGEKEECLRRA
jgi:hypothetical protein